MVPHYRPQVLPKDDWKMQLNEPNVIRGNDHVRQGILYPWHFQLPAIVKQREGGWLQKVSYWDKKHVVGGFRHSCCRKRWRGTLRRGPYPTSSWLQRSLPLPYRAWKLCHLFSLEEIFCFISSICFKLFLNRRGSKYRLCNSIWHSWFLSPSNVNNIWRLAWAAKDINLSLPPGPFTESLFFYYCTFLCRTSPKHLLGTFRRNEAHRAEEASLPPHPKKKTHPLVGTNLRSTKSRFPFPLTKHLPLIKLLHVYSVIQTPTTHRVFL